MSSAYSSPGWSIAAYRTGSQTFGVNGVQHRPAACALTWTKAQPLRSSSSRPSRLSTAFSNWAVTLTHSSITAPLKSRWRWGRVMTTRVVYGAVLPSAARAVPETRSSCSV